MNVTLYELIIFIIYNLLLLCLVIWLILNSKTISKLKKADEFKSQLIIDKGHDLRSPLNAIIGFSDLLITGIEGEINDKQKRDLYMISHSGHELLFTINNIIEFLRIESGTLDNNFEQVNIKQIVEKLIKNNQSKIDNNGKIIKFKKELPEELPLINLDEEKIKKIINYYICSFLKFVNSGEIELILKNRNKNVLFELKYSGDYFKEKKAINLLDYSPGSKEKIGFLVIKEYLKNHKAKIWQKTKKWKQHSLFVEIPKNLK
ncbi:sensor histidine kinase [Candidatus Margulisiibacteriota bacterium]